MSDVLSISHAAFCRRQFYKHNQGGKRTLHNHSYLPEKIGGRFQGAHFAAMRRNGLKRIGIEHNARRQAEGRNAASRTSREQVWSRVVWLCEKQSKLSRVGVVPVIPAGLALLSWMTGCCRATVAAALRDLEAWGLLVYHPGHYTRQSVVGLRVAMGEHPRAAKVARAQLKHPWFRAAAAELLDLPQLVALPTSRELRQQRHDARKPFPSPPPSQPSLIPPVHYSPAEAVGHCASDGYRKKLQAKDPSTGVITLLRSALGQDVAERDLAAAFFSLRTAEASSSYMDALRARSLGDG